MGDYNPIVVFLVVLLAPGIPAYILYSRLPPEKTIVNGPFKGFQVQLTGAFAAYFVLVLLAMSFMVTFLSKRRVWYANEQFVTWIVKGELKFDDSSGAKIGDANITFSPRLVEVRGDGSFFTVVPLPTGMQRNATTMQIDHPLYDPKVVHLSPAASPKGYGTPQALEFDTTDHVINIPDPILLKPKAKGYVEETAYQPQLVPSPGQ